MVDEHIRLMFDGEKRVLSVFKDVFLKHFPGADQALESPFKTTAYSEDLKYFQSAITCFKKLEHYLGDLTRDGKFEQGFQKHNLQNAFKGFWGSGQATYPECKVLL